MGLRIRDWGSDLSSNDDTTHGYIRVTEVLSLMTDYSSIDPRILKQASDRGTAVHEAIAGVIPPEALPNQWQGYLKAAREWESVYMAKYAWRETRLYDDELNLTGQLDGLIVRPSRHVLVDWKTAQSYSPSWDVQMNAYMRLLSKNGYDVTEAVVVQLTKGGRYKATRIYYDPSKWSYFLTLLSVYKENLANGSIEARGPEVGSRSSESPGTQEAEAL